MRTTCRTGERDRGEPQLIMPYSLDTNDMGFVNPHRLRRRREFFTYVKDGFDVLSMPGGDLRPR